MRKSEYSDYSDYSEYSETRPPESPALAGVLCIIKSKSTAESSSDSAKVGTIPVSALDSASPTSGFL